MASNYSKKVKGLKRGANMAGKLHKYFFWILLGFLALVSGSAYLYWKLERGGEGSVFEALWTILFTLIGQGEFANTPHTIVGRVIVFALSIVGISVLGVVLSEVLTRVMKYNLKNMLGLNACRYEGHTIFCGWNGRAELVLKELAASGRQVAVLTRAKPAELSHYDVFFVAGEPTNEARLIQAGIEKAESAIVFAEPQPGLTNDDLDAHTVLTALAVESLRPEIYTVVELLDPANERHARRTHVDDIVYCESTLADIVAACASQQGISSFIGDILTYSDRGSALRAADIEPQWENRSTGELFAAMQADGELPLGVMTPDASSGAERWRHEINPPASRPVRLPMRVVFISKNKGK
ncbi:MAG: potassium channel family protein [Pyramidobacter sp.]|uniref:potassium channel family protein n=1 Tax=Pyramidobacter sp. TaxID=1943581 RepID=UPI002A7F1FCC|nr:potassium channel family protein [Pyramidobacter sp.]MDY4032839.1 potassium channel family protein [Pyramidobacter sp.]